MSDGNYYDQGNCKLLIGILQNDIDDDEVIDALGESENRNTDNFLKTIQIDVPPSTISNDLKMMTNYRVVSLYKAKKQDFDAAKYWDAKADALKESIIEGITKNVESSSIVIDRFGPITSYTFSNNELVQ